MTEPAGDRVGGAVDRKSTKRGRRTLDELVAIVRPAGKPEAVRVFAHDEMDQAQQYADEYGAAVEMLAE
ncbi:hypothetical protein [Gordonia sihwensis]|uniref:hypothetical protein n=1 Tax=Gordonia sihwensis TaxID=173559 RepID=UPI003D963D27